MTYHNTILSSDESGLRQTARARESTIDLQSVECADGAKITSGPLFGFRCVKNGDALSFEKDGLFLSAKSDQVSITLECEAIGPWEVFRGISAEGFDEREGFYRSPESEMIRFGRRIAELNEAGLPVKIYFGCGPVPMLDYLNVDIVNLAQEFSVDHPDSYFLFPYIGSRIEIDDNVSDYIFHEDLIEHVDQLSQIQFLAEALRIMKPGSWHRVNTPSLLNTMKLNSDFSKGSDGVYTGERQWEHIALFTHAYLTEIANLVGYREIVFNGKGGGVSPFATPDRRPSSERDEIVGNIYADLLK